MLALYGPVVCDICGVHLENMAELEHHVKLEKQRTVVKHNTNCKVSKVCSLCGKLLVYTFVYIVLKHILFLTWCCHFIMTTQHENFIMTTKIFFFII